MITDEKILEVAVDAYSISDLIRRCGLKATGSNFSSFKKRVIKLNIIFKQRPRIIGVTKRPLEDYLIKNGPTIGSSKLRRLLVRAGIKENRCEECNIIDWCNKKLSFHLDHIDGNHGNNELINLKILCPNCHSQTKTYARIKTISNNILKRETLIINGEERTFTNYVSEYCQNCNKPLTGRRVHGLCRECYKNPYIKIDIISKTKTKCSKCDGPVSPKSKTGLCVKCYQQPFKVERPSHEQLQLDLEKLSFCAVARKYGVSDNCIRKWLKFHKKQFEIIE